MIFLSHNRNDKPFVEPIALKLAAAFGQSNVFYDSWSIQPGEGIIDRMSQGLGQMTHFFFFVSANSLKSKMVSLEWQNALLSATNGTCRMVALRCDQSALPPIMSQSLYIDMYSVGLEAAAAQMADVVKGVSTYRAQTQPFSNLVWSTSGDNAKLVVEIKAKFFLEPIARFLLLTTNKANEVAMSVQGEGAFLSGFTENVPLNTGLTFNVHSVGINRGITPTMPVRIELSAQPGHLVHFSGVMHQTGSDQYQGVPMEQQGR